MRNEQAIRSGWKALRAHFKALSSTRIDALFDADPDRFARFSTVTDDLLFDFSKCKLDDQALNLLTGLAETAGVGTARDAMFTGARINSTENRSVLHTALRNPAASRVVDGIDIMPEIRAERARAYAFAEAAHAGHLYGATAQGIDTFVWLGIGGSDLGPSMVIEALHSNRHGRIGTNRFYFVSNIDGSWFDEHLDRLVPDRTMFIVASKTFTTVETMLNAGVARAWLVEALGEAAISKHFAAVSAARDKVAAFGIAPEHTFGFGEWVGGRYSIWSAIGLPAMMQYGPALFDRFLEGAAAMDRHFLETPFARNVPVLLALIGIWHRNICNYPTRAVIPYDQRLRRFPAYLQQLDMESNGKRVTKAGKPVGGATGPIIWGDTGVNGQHAFFQLLHQGTDVVPVEFLLAAEGAGDNPLLADHHPLLVANCFAQSQALMRGRTLEEAGGNPHRVFPGDRPSVTMMYPRLDPFRLGQIIALYEHRVFVEAAIWNINAFDQWGVELGKELATRLDGTVKTGLGLEMLNGSTAGLIRAARTMAKS